MAQQFEIMTGEEELIKSSIILAEAFSKLKPQLEKQATDRNGVSRIWKDPKGNYYLEFYHRVAIQFASKEDLEKTEKVDFIRIPYTKRKGEISFITNIEKSTFEKLQAKATEIQGIKEISFFGKFYQMNNANAVLVEWSSSFQKENRYSILESLRTLMGIDWELVDYLDDDPGERAIDDPKEEIEIAFEFADGVHSNAEAFRDYLAAKLNLEAEVLDFSKESLTPIEASLSWNADDLNTHNLVLPFTSYIGEILIREKSFKWQKSVEQEHYILVSAENKPCHLLWDLREALVDTDYGLPEVKWVYETIVNGRN